MREKHFFQSGREHKLCGILSDPKEDPAKPVIIFCHGFSTNKDGKTWVHLEKILNKKEISTFRFDFLGHGESEGRFEETTTSGAVDDVLAALRFIQSQGYEKIGLMGSSFGGMVSILAASQSGDFYLLVLKSPLSDYQSTDLTGRSEKEIQYWKEKGFIEFKSGDNETCRLNYSFYEDAQKIDAYEAAKNITVPTLIVHGEADESVPVKQSRKLASLIPDSRLETIPGCDHTYSHSQHFDRLLSLSSQFIVENS